ncbi:uncharacterized protein LOC115028789 [Cottoperca gobio]|uniref:Uncharacterized protein LOC115028789 n=1 Tax=Cottoperca gobio TaxID=56716 RepID=A0A6J2S9Q4_COTGO|nr:uncharacterized protein LOC115028789 [Cottoperca gobio]
MEFRCIKTSLFLILLLLFIAAATGQKVLYHSVRDGGEGTLPCNDVMDDQSNCDGTVWTFRGSLGRATVPLVERGQSVENTDRLSVTEKCSLRIKKVTVQDAGRYDCQQFGSDPNTVLLSVVTFTEHHNNDQVTLDCSVSIYDFCRHTVKWLFEGRDVEHSDIKTSQSLCSASVTVLTSRFSYTQRLLTCAVSFINDKGVQIFSPQSSGEDTQPTTTTTTTGPTTDVLLYIAVPLLLVALLIITVAFIRWKRTKGQKTQKDDHDGLTSNAAATEISQDQADPEDGVSYASVSYTKKTDSKAQVRSKTDDDEGDAVTYMSVKASSHDPSSLYATIS